MSTVSGNQGKAAKAVQFSIGERHQTDLQRGWSQNAQHPLAVKNESTILDESWALRKPAHILWNGSLRPVHNWHRGWSQCRQFLRHALKKKKTLKHGRAIDKTQLVYKPLRMLHFLMLESSVVDPLASYWRKRGWNDSSA